MERRTIKRRTKLLGITTPLKKIRSMYENFEEYDFVNQGISQNVNLIFCIKDAMVEHLRTDPDLHDKPLCWTIDQIKKIVSKKLRSVHDHVSPIHDLIMSELCHHEGKCKKCQERITMSLTANILTIETIKTKILTHLYSFDLFRPGSSTDEDSV